MVPAEVALAEAAQHDAVEFTDRIAPGLERPDGILAAVEGVAPTAIETSAAPPAGTPGVIVGYGRSGDPLFDYGLNFIRIRLFTIEGMSTPAPYGGKARQVMIDVDPAACQAKGLAPQDVVNSLLAENVLVHAPELSLG